MMRTGRTPKLICVVGTNGTGKTYTITEIAKAELKKNGKVLVITPHENEWTNIDGMPIPDCSNIYNMKGIERIHVADELDIIPKIIKEFHNGIVIFDDVRYYIDANINKEFKKILISRKQMMCDIILAAHSIGDIPPSVFFYNPTFVLKKTTTLFTERKNKLLPEVYNELVKAQQRVNANKNKYHQEILEIK